MSSAEAATPRPSLPCWVCGSMRTRPCKTARVLDTLSPDDLRITDARYGLTLPLVRCDECGFRFADAQEVEKLDSLYAELDDPGYQGSQESRLLQMRWLLAWTRRGHPAARTLLDVGAASGLLVAEARREGLDATGVEPSGWLVDLAQREHGIELLHGVLPHAGLAETRFDIVSLIDVIEHVADPVGLLRACVEQLADDGRLLLITPDVSSLAAKLLGGHWWHYRAAHVGYFDRRSLQTAFERVGLEAESWTRARWFFSVRYLASRAESYLPVGGINRLSERTPPLRWIYDRIMPLNLFDSYAVLLRKASVQP